MKLSSMSPPPPMEESTSVAPSCPGNDIKNHNHHHHHHHHRHRVSSSDASKQDRPDKRQTEASSPLSRLQPKPRRSHRRARNSSKDRSRRRRRRRRKKHPKLEDLLVKQHDDPYYLRWNPTGDYDSGDEHWWKEMDTLEHDREATQQRADEDALYSEYKKHTNTVVHWGNATWIEHHGKNKCRETSASATSLRALIQRLFDLKRRGVPMPRSIRKNLECAIELREEFHRRVIQGTRAVEPGPEQGTKRPKRLSRRKRTKGSEEPERNGDTTGVADADIHKQVTHQWLLKQLKLLSDKFCVLPDNDDEDDNDNEDDNNNSSNKKKPNSKENAANRSATVQLPTLNSVRDTLEIEHGCSSEPQTPSTTGSLSSKDAGSGSDDRCENGETASSGASSSSSSSSSSSPSIGTYCDDDSSQSTGLSSSSLEEWDELFGDDGSVVSASENSRTREETRDLKLRLALLTKPTTEWGDDTKAAKDSTTTNNEKDDANDVEEQSKDNFEKDVNVNVNENADANVDGNAGDSKKSFERITHTIATSVVTSDGRLQVDSNHLRCAALYETKAEANPETKNASSLSTGIQHKNSTNPASHAGNVSAVSPPSDRQRSNPRTKSLSNSKWTFNPRSNSVCFHRPVKQLPNAPLPGRSSLRLPLSTEASQNSTRPRTGPAGRSSSDSPSYPLESETVPLSTHCIHSGDAQEPIIISAGSKQQNSTAQNAQQMRVKDETPKERNLEQHTRKPVCVTGTTCTVTNHKHDSGLVLTPASQEVPPSTNSPIWEFRSSKDSKDVDAPWDEEAAPLTKEGSFSFDSDPPEHWELLLPDDDENDDIIPQNDETITASLLPMPILSSNQMQNQKNKEEITGTLKPPKESPKEGGVPPVLSPMLRMEYGSIWDMASQGAEELPTMLRGSLGIPLQTNEASNEGPSRAKEETLPFHSDPPEHWELLLPDENETNDLDPEEDKTITALLLPMPIATSSQMQNKPTEEVTGTPKPSKEIAKEGVILPVLLPSRSNPVQQYGSIWDMTSHGVEDLTTMLRSSIYTPVPTDEASSSDHHDPPEDWEMLCQDDDDCGNERGKENDESRMSAGEAEHILDGNTYKGLLSEELQQEQEKPIEASSVALSTTFKTIDNAILPGRDGAIRLLSRANKAPYNIVPSSDLDSVWDIFSNKEMPMVGSDYACGPPTLDLVRDELNLRNDRPEDDWESKYDS